MIWYGEQCLDLRSGRRSSGGTGFPACAVDRLESLSHPKGWTKRRQTPHSREAASIGRRYVVRAGFVQTSS